MSRMLDAATLHGMPDDPSYALPDDMSKELEKRSIPLQWIDEFENIRSQDQFDFLASHLQVRAEDQARLANSGGVGMVASSLAPVMFASNVVGGEAASLIKGVGRIAGFAKAGLGAGAGNVVAINTFGDEDHRFVDGDDRLVSLNVLAENLGAGRVVTTDRAAGVGEAGGLTAGDIANAMTREENVVAVERVENFTREELVEKRTGIAGKVYLTKPGNIGVCHCGVAIRMSERGVSLVLRVSLIAMQADASNHSMQTCKAHCGPM